MSSPVAMPCSSCGADEVGGRFCRRCGAPNVQPPATPVSSGAPLGTRPRSFLRSSLVCAGALAVAVAFLAGFHIAGSSDDAPSEGAVAGSVTPAPTDVTAPPASPTTPATPPYRPPATPPYRPPTTERTVPTEVYDAGDSPGGHWIAQLASVPFEEGRSSLDRMLASVRTAVPGAVVLVSDNYASLRPGYWVVYEAGPFRDGLTAIRYCDARGRTTRNSCMGRFLSHDAADITELCFRRDDGTYTDPC